MAPYNHQSLQAEQGIKSLLNILTKHLTGSGEMWPDYLPFATLAHNTYNSLKFKQLFSIWTSIWEKAEVTIRLRDWSRYKGVSNI